MKEACIISDLIHHYMENQIYIIWYEKIEKLV